MTYLLQKAYTDLRQKKAQMICSTINLEGTTYVKESAVTEYILALTELQKIMNMDHDAVLEQEEQEK